MEVDPPQDGLHALMLEVQGLPGAAAWAERASAARAPGPPRLGLWGPAKGGRSTLLRALAGGAPVAAVAARACTPGEVWLRRGPPAAVRAGARVDGPEALRAAGAWTDLAEDPAPVVEVWWPEAPEALVLVELPAELDPSSPTWAHVDALLLVADAQQGLSMALLDAAAGFDPVIPLMGIVLTRADRLAGAATADGADPDARVAEARASAQRRLRAWGGPEVPVWTWPPGPAGWAAPRPPPARVAARRASVVRAAVLALAEACRRERDLHEARALAPSPVDALRGAAERGLDRALGPALDAAVRAADAALPQPPARDDREGDGQRLLTLQRAAVSLDEAGPGAADAAWRAAADAVEAALREAAQGTGAGGDPVEWAPLGPPPAPALVGPVPAPPRGGLARLGGWVAGAAAAGALAGAAVGGGVLLPAVLAGGAAVAAWGGGDPRPGLLREAEAWLAARRGAWRAAAMASVEAAALRGAGAAAIDATLGPLETARAARVQAAAAEALRWADRARRLAEAAPPDPPAGEGLGVAPAAPPPRRL